jgi:hypothetical protein
MIGLFREAYDPVLECPRVFTADILAITWIMLETSSRKRLRRWETIFRNPHHPSVKQGLRPHVDSVCSLHANHPEFREVGVGVDDHCDDGPRLRLKLVQLGEYCERVFVYGCGLAAPANPIQLMESIVSAGAFQESLGLICNVASLLRCSIPKSLGRSWHHANDGTQAIFSKSF